MHRYSFLHPEELMAALVSGALFSKVDLADAYYQIEVDPESRKYFVISTRRGLFRYTRLPFGFCGAPAIFQSTIDMILQGLPGVVEFLDDIIVTGKEEQEQIERLRKLCRILREVGIWLKKESAISVFRASRTSDTLSTTAERGLTS